MSFIPHTDAERRQMLDVIGVQTIEQLFGDIPPELRPQCFDLPAGKSEAELYRFFSNLAKKNSTRLISFLGAGFYDHYIPAAVEAVCGRPEFYTAYTPYQPEASQGWLQAMFEYQTAICALTGLDAANASLYDGGTALYEAAMMAVRVTGRRKIIVDSGVNLVYRSMLYTYTRNLAIEFFETPVVHGQSSRQDIERLLDDKTAAVILQNPNFFGAVDDHTDIVAAVHRQGALAIQSVYPVALGLLKTPAEMGVDIATGEGQSLGNPLSFGGPYLGFLATRPEYVRKMPGRICGQTVDRQGRRGFVLTLQAREQHIRREKAMSNICSNQALCALRAMVFVALLGPEGIKQLAQENYRKAEFAKEVFSRIPGVTVKRSAPTFNEFTVTVPRQADAVVNQMIDKGFVCGFPLGRFYQNMDDYLLVCVTEKRTKEEIVTVAECLEAVLCD